MELSDSLKKAWEDEVRRQLSKPLLGQFKELTEEEKDAHQKLMSHRLWVVGYYMGLGTRNPIAELHRPDLESVQGILYRPYFLECQGCDAGEYAEAPPAWPCRTALIIMKQNDLDWDKNE